MIISQRNYGYCSQRKNAAFPVALSKKKIVIAYGIARQPLLLTMGIFD